MGAGSCSGKRAWICMQLTGTMLSRGDHNSLSHSEPGQPVMSYSGQSILCCPEISRAAPQWQPCSCADDERCGILCAEMA